VTEHPLYDLLRIVVIAALCAPVLYAGVVWLARVITRIDGRRDQ
jgi:hypothetical protein